MQGPHDSQLNLFLVNKAPHQNNRRDYEEDSLYQFNDVAWESTTLRPRFSSSIRSIEEAEGGGGRGVDEPKLNLKVDPTTPKKKKHNTTTPVSPRKSKSNNNNKPPPRLTKEQKEIANEIRDFLQKQKSSRSVESAPPMSGLQAHLAKHNGKTKMPQNTPSSPRRKPHRSKSSSSGYKATATSTPSTPGTKKGSKSKKDRRGWQASSSESPSFSIRSFRSLPACATTSPSRVASPYSNKSFNNNHHKSPQHHHHHYSWKSDHLQCPKLSPLEWKQPRDNENETSAQDFDILLPQTDTEDDEDDPCPKHYCQQYGLPDNNHRVGESSMVFSDDDDNSSFLISDADDSERGGDESLTDQEDKQDALHASLSSLTPSSVPGLVRNVFQSRRRRRHYRLRVASPVNHHHHDDDDDVADRLGGSIVQRHGG